MATTTKITLSDVANNIRGNKKKPELREDAPPMDVDIKTPQWLKDAASATGEAIGDAAEWTGEKVAEAFPAKDWSPYNTQQLMLGALPILTGLAFGGTRGGAIGGKVGMKTLDKMEDQVRQFDKQQWERDYKERQLDLSETKAINDYALLKARLGNIGFDQQMQQELLPLTIQQKQTEIKKDEAQTKKIETETQTIGREGAQGKKLPDSAINRLTEGVAIPSSLEDTASIVEANKDLFTAWVGGFKALNKADDRVQTLQAELKAKAQQVGRFLEDGVLRREDEIKYREMMPQLDDSYETAMNKLRIVRRLVAKKYNQLYGAYSGQGFNMVGMGGERMVPEIPEVLGVKKRVRDPKIEALATKQGWSYKKASDYLKWKESQNKGGK